MFDSANGLITRRTWLLAGALLTALTAGWSAAEEPRYYKLPFLERLPRSELAHNERFHALASEEVPFSSEDRGLLERLRPFMEDFLAWYPAGLARTPADTRKRLGLTEDSAIPDYCAISDGSKALRVLLGGLAWQSQEVAYVRLILASLAYARDVHGAFDLKSNVFPCIFSGAIEQPSLRHLLRHTAAKPLSAGQRELLLREFGRLDTPALDVERLLADRPDQVEARIDALLDQTSRGEYLGRDRIVRWGVRLFREKVKLLVTRRVTEHYRRVRNLLALPPSRSLSALESCGRTWRLRLGSTPSWSSFLEAPAEVAALRIQESMTPDPTSLVREHATTECYRRGLLVVLQVLGFQAAKGRLAADLTELERWTGKAVPSNPFTDAPLSYRVDADAFRLEASLEQPTAGSPIRPSALVLWGPGQ